MTSPNLVSYASNWVSPPSHSAAVLCDVVLVCRWIVIVRLRHPRVLCAVRLPCPLYRLVTNRLGTPLFDFVLLPVLALQQRVAAKTEEKILELLFLRWSEHHKRLNNFIRSMNFITEIDLFSANTNEIAG
ncbi:hypothetical protein AAHE18_06G175300 [Arachis hypogaea]